MASTGEIARAVAALRAGELVAFPTETVYGLGADCENASAVKRVYAVKGRPETHPLIVHVAPSAKLSDWSSAVPEAAARVARAFWPGPLTIVLRRGPRVSLAATGGLETVALRVPAHEVAIELLEHFGGGVAAPSANRFGRVSPTRAEHVRADLGDEVTVVLDGGACAVGLESTILDLSGDVPRLLRPGGVGREQLEAVLGAAVQVGGGSTRAPGMLASHYAPLARVELAPRDRLPELASQLLKRGERVAWLHFGGEAPAGMPEVTLVLDLGRDPSRAAQELYAALRQADAAGCDAVLAEPGLKTLGARGVDGDEATRAGICAAIEDRLRKAAGLGSTNS